MSHNDDSFWIAIFKKSPLIALPMAAGGILGAGIGVYNFADAEKYPFLSLVIFLITCTTVGGIFLGLILGVVIDSLIGAVRNSDKKKRK